jgi:hypothetical protein
MTRLADIDWPAWIALAREAAEAKLRRGREAA